MTDEEIISLRDKGQTEEAFRGIVDAYSKKLYWHVRRIVGSHEDTDDLLQEIFVKIWSAFPAFRGESRLYTWIWRIATNESLNFLRKQKVRAALSFKPISDEEERRMDDDPWFDGDAAERELRKALSRLPNKQRLVFSMRYYDEMKYEEISEILDTSVGSLKASYHIAYEKIKDWLKENF